MLNYDFYLSPCHSSALRYLQIQYLETIGR